MSQVDVIAIDGPVASGKGSVSSGVAKALDFHVLDSGALYPVGKKDAPEGLSTFLHEKKKAWRKK